MRALFALLADVALAHPDGKIYMLGGGIEILRPPSLPFVLPNMSFVVKIEFSPAETGRERLIEVIPMDSDGRPVSPPARVTITPTRNPEYPGLPVSTQIVLNMRDLPIEQAGSLAFAVLVDGHVVASVPLHVIDPTVATEG